MNSIRRSSYLGPGFTLVELMVVVLLMGIVAVTAIPAMDHVREIRSGSARDDIVRNLELARGMAMASGAPHGLQIEVEDSSITIVEIDDSGSAEPSTDPLTGAYRTTHIEILYPGVSITGFTNGDGTSGSGTVWFDFDATPHTRPGSGTNVVVCDRVSQITLSSGSHIHVHPSTGLIEVP